MYYPFGSLQPGRHSQTAVTSRYGFNGMEKDNELKGDGNSLDFGARMYDSRIGRWLSLDPLMAKYPELSPYNHSANNPIFYIDPDGREIIIAGDAAFVKQTKTLLAKIAATDVGYNVLKALSESNTKYTIDEAWWIATTQYEDKEDVISYDDNPWVDDVDGGYYSALIGLSHELYHAFQDENNELKYDENGDLKGDAYRGHYERGAVKFSNYIRGVYGFGKFRKKYSGIGPQGYEENFFKKESSSFKTDEKFISIEEIKIDEVGEIEVTFETERYIDRFLNSKKDEKKTRKITGIIEIVE